MRERERFVVRSTELEMGLSSSDKLIGMEVDTAASKTSSSKPSSTKLSSIKPRTVHTLEESCGLDEETLFLFRDWF